MFNDAAKVQNIFETHNIYRKNVQKKFFEKKLAKCCGITKIVVPLQSEICV